MEFENILFLWMLMDKAVTASRKIRKKELRESKAFFISVQSYLLIKIFSNGFRLKCLELY